MCTVSVIALPRHGIRLVINRDESDQRPPAIPPRWRDVGSGVRAIWPQDPQGGGTWVAANDAGLVFAILNQNLKPGPPLPAIVRSRGEIIPSLAASRSLSGATILARALHVANYPPFRLVIASAREEVSPVAAVGSWDSTSWHVNHFVPVPLCLASSGLGDALVQERVPLFRELAGRHQDAARQDAFHAHQWPGREHLSVMMARPGYRTVSVTTVEVDDDGVRMDSRPVARPLSA